MNAKLTAAELEQLATLLVKHNNAIVAGSDQDASIHGRRMDSALCRDLLGTLARHMPLDQWSEHVKAAKSAD